MSSHVDLDALLSEVARERHRDALRPYADALIERGDLHGELIVIALAGERSVELARREAELVAHVQGRLEQALGRRPARLAWRDGFVDTIGFDLTGDGPFDVLPVLAAQPAARLLRRLEISAVRLDARGDLAPVLAELARLAPQFPRLTELVVREGEDLGNPWLDGPAELGDVSVLYPAFPGLERLELEAATIELGAIEDALPALRALGLGRIEPADARHLVRGTWPLRELWLAFQGYDARSTAQLGPLLHRRFPRLETLSLQVPPLLQRFLVEELIGAPLLASVRALALPGPLDDACYDALIARAGELAHLERLRLDERWVRSVPLRRQLARAFGLRLELR